jgi:hypothetical protein
MAREITHFLGYRRSHGGSMGRKRIMTHAKALAHLREGDPAACVAALASTPKLAGVVAALISGGFIRAAEDALMEAGE